MINCYFEKVKFSIKSLFLFAFLALPCMAGVLEDSQKRFVLEDGVLESAVHSCDTLDRLGGKFLPEAAMYMDGNSMPFRSYRVALPTSDKPTVSLSDIKTVPLGRPLCKEGPGGYGEELKFLPVEVSAPFQRDGLWMTDIRVPLYIRNGSSVALRKNFKLEVRFNASAAGVNPGKRALSRVLNPVAASRFGKSLASSRKALRKAASGESSNVTFLSKLQVGDRDVATFSEDGLYAVPFSTIRNSLLLWQRQNELDGIPLDRISLFGASPDTLADMGPGTEERIPDQLFEIPIEIRDHTPGGDKADGIFDDGDTLIFVGYGNAFWKRCDREDPLFENGKMDYFHSYSPYSFYQYFLFGIRDSGKGLRFSDKVKVPSGAGKDLKWMRYVRAEKEALLIDTYFGRQLDWEKSTGKEWFWQWHSRLDSTNVPNSVLSLPQTEKLPGLQPSGNRYVAVTYFPHRSVWSSGAVSPGDQVNNVSYSSRSYAQRMVDIRFAFVVNGERVERSGMSLLPGGNFRMDGPPLSVSGNRYSLDMLPNDNQFDRFDGYSVAYEWKPEVDSAEWLLPGAVSGVVNIPALSGVQVMKFRNMRPVGFLTSSNGIFKDSVSADDDVRYLAVRSGTYRNGLKAEGLPPRIDGILNDLSKPNSKIEYLIVAPHEFIEVAKSLAEFRSEGSTSNLPTSVVAVEDIYRQYTAGRVSPVAIRNYISYVYSICPNMRYVLLAGLGHFDYRGLSGKMGPSYIPPFEKEDAVVEDFFAVLDSGEQVRFGRYDLDVAVGRLPVSSLTDFSHYLAKAKEYDGAGIMDNSNWRSSLLFAADDARNNGHKDSSRHILNQENVAKLVDSLSIVNNARWNVKKLYLLEYAEDAMGQKKEATTDLINLMNQGALFTTYFGHGSETDWANEGLLKASYVSRLSNKGRYTILGSFSCTVGRFDRGKSSLSQEFLVSPGAGSIASIGATRETFGSYNSELGRNIILNAIGRSGERLGNAFMKTKNETVSREYSAQRYNNERYILMGEPVLKMPDDKMKVSLDTKIDTIWALDKMSLSGSVSGLDDGFVDLMMLEGRKSKRIDLQVSGDSADVLFDGAFIYSETVPVKNGRFTTEFITPRKISIGDTAAELSLWAYSPKNGGVGRAWVRNIAIGGVSSYADSLQDTVPPTIQLQSCYAGGTATGFADGSTVKLQSPACLQVVVEDSSALDFREQADEGISFEVVGVQDPFHPWPYIEQTAKRAKVRMNFATEQYPAGKYVFKVRALDVLGNASIKTLNVEITDDMEMGLADVFNVPNPMGKKGTTFYFKNLAVDRDSRVNIFIYNQNGKLVRVLKNAVSGVTHWNGHDNHGRLLANGLYHYVVRSEVSATENSGKKTWTKKQKLLISR
ncbi:C25 family cysteine peptidase [uncultured Fibrobacter sp.]|uniref:C25 family cysteine peptidase n=1 Tax=uncultured Fibrobacter sp. TaxID=261512 RepID=UPI0026113B30|nr:C25 family cysteine peptidase [uncultured Fibrobacter sp.]